MVTIAVTLLGFARTGDCLGNEFVMREQLK